MCNRCQQTFYEDPENKQTSRLEGYVVSDMIIQTLSLKHKSEYKQYVNKGA